MAKGARASTKKANHQKLKSRVFGPVESARTERLSAKLLELASQPKSKPVKEDIVMDSEEGMGYSSSFALRFWQNIQVLQKLMRPPLRANSQRVRALSETLTAVADFSCAEMEVDQEATKSSDRPKTSSKGRIEKRRQHRKASIVFPKYIKGKRIGGSRGKK
jgi:hypothetical protein